MEPPSFRGGFEAGACVYSQGAGCLSSSGGSSMLELMRLMPRRVRMVSFTLGVQIFFTQVALLMFHAIQLHEPASSSNLTGYLTDYMWYVYREIAPALPMVLIVTIGFVVLAQILARFMVSGPYIRELPTWIRNHPLKTALNVALLLGLIVSLSMFRSSYLGGMLGGLCITGLVFQAIEPWINWVNTWRETDSRN